MKGKTRLHNLSQERLFEVLDYNPTSGVFVWKISPAKNIKAGKIAGGSKGKSGHQYIRIDGEEITTSRLAWFYVNGEWPDRRVRFKNGNPRDASVDNLTLFNGVAGEFDHRSVSGRAQYQKAYRALTPHLEKGRALRESFGISLADYSAMVAAQDNKCAICAEPETQMRGGKVKALAVDHCHETGKIRELLCTACNQAIGKFKDDRNVLIAALRYLDKHSGDKNVASLDLVGETQ